MVELTLLLPLIPAKAGTQAFCFEASSISQETWVPGFAGMCGFFGLEA